MGNEKISSSAIPLLSSLTGEELIPCVTPGVNGKTTPNGLQRGLVQIVDINQELFNDLASARAYVQSYYSGTLSNESYLSGIYYFTPNSSAVFSGASQFLENVGASFVDEYGFVAEFGDDCFNSNFSANKSVFGNVYFGVNAFAYCTNGNISLGDCEFEDSAFIHISKCTISIGNGTFSGNYTLPSTCPFYSAEGIITIKDIALNILPTPGFAHSSAAKFFINGNIGGTEGANYTHFFHASTSEIHVPRVKYTSNAGAIQGDLQTAKTNGATLFFGGIDKENVTNKVTNFTSPNNTEYPTTQATIDLVDNRIQSNIKIIGDWDATSGSMPLADESNTTPFITMWGSTIKQGWAFRVGYGQAGTVGAFDYEEGDVVYALLDNAGATPADWGDLDHNLQQSTETLRGTGKVITAAIIADETTTDDERFVTGKKLWLNFWTRVLALAHTFAAKITFTIAPRFSSVTASQYLKVDGSKDLTSVSSIPATDVTEYSTHRFTTDTEKNNWNNKPVYSYVSGSNFTSGSLTLVDVTGLSNALDANSVYEFVAKLTVESSSNAGLNTGMNYSVSGATIEAGEVGARDAEVGKVVRLNAFNTPHATAAWLRISATPQTHEIKGIVRTGANAGNLTVQVLKVSSGTVKVYIDSYLKTTKLL
jgi:hypothetical protein